MNKLIIALVLLSGCTMKGEASNPNKIVQCVDLRDGEVFYYNTNTVSNMRIVIGVPVSFDIVDSDGNKRRLSSEMELYTKCKEQNEKHN